MMRRGTMDGEWVSAYDHFPSACCVGVFSIMRMISEKSHPAEKNEIALDILKKRYAKGEISREDFEMKSDLKKD